jgi:sigma-B regulation protein RsbU (phosphoserine phosphatase)
MRSRLLRLRLWLDRNGVFPLGRLAVITCYLLAFDLLLFAVQQIAGVFHWHFGEYLGAWVTFLSLITIVLLFVLAVRRISGQLLWRMRNRLIVTYVFIGVVPLLLLVSLAGLALYLFAGQFSTYIVTSRLDSELQQLRAGNAVVAAELAGGLNAGENTQTLESVVKTANDIRVTAWLDGKVFFNEPANDSSLSLPHQLQPDLTAVVRDGGGLFLRSLAESQTAKGKLIVVSSSPLGERVLLHIASGLGEITLEEPTHLGVGNASQVETSVGSFRPTLTVGNVPAYRHLLDLMPVVLSTSISVVNWSNDGDSKAAIDVQTRASALYDHLFAAPGEFARYVEALLLAAALVFAIIEVVALWIGTRLTRTVTGAVSNLYRATTHVNRGDFSHRIPITSNDQLAALAGSFNLMTESIEKLVLEQKEKQRLENEITIAQEVQAQLFPRRISQLASLEVHGFCRPARSVSGDYYDFLSLGSDRMVLAVGDVSGKGISAALLMATIHSAVRAYSMEGIPVFRQAEAVGAGTVLASKYDPIVPGAEASPSTLLSLLNHQLYHSTPMEKYATLFLATYDGDGRRLTFSNAGHLPPLLLGASGSIRRLEHGGTVVGLFDDLSYDEGSVQMRAGDIFLAYSDGVTEPENEFGEFGEPRLIELVQENRDRSLAQITEIVTAAVDDWIGGAEQPDDVTLVLARAR